jgi:hypothetical protein
MYPSHPVRPRSDPGPYFFAGKKDLKSGSCANGRGVFERTCGPVSGPCREGRWIYADPSTHSRGKVFISEFEQGEIGPELFRQACKFGLEG